MKSTEFENELTFGFEFLVNFGLKLAKFAKNWIFDSSQDWNFQFENTQKKFMVTKHDVRMELGGSRLGGLGTFFGWVGNSSFQLSVISRKILKFWEKNSILECNTLSLLYINRPVFSELRWKDMRY